MFFVFVLFFRERFASFAVAIAPSLWCERFCAHLLFLLQSKLISCDTAGLSSGMCLPWCGAKARPHALVERLCASNGLVHTCFFFLLRFLHRLQSRFCERPCAHLLFLLRFFTGSTAFVVNGFVHSCFSSPLFAPASPPLLRTALVLCTRTASALRPRVAPTS